MKVLVFVLALLSAVSVSVCSRPSFFFGGSYSRSNSLAADYWAFYGDDGTGAGPGWQTPIGKYGIFAMDYVNGMVFAGGEFGVAYWDGSHWCSIRQQVDDVVFAVKCIPPRDCYAAGDFGNVDHANGTARVNFLVHYQWNGEEWIWVNDLEHWTLDLDQDSLRPLYNFNVFQITRLDGDLQFWLGVRSGFDVDDKKRGWNTYFMDRMVRVSYDNSPRTFSSVADFDIDHETNKLFLADDEDLLECFRLGRYSPDCESAFTLSNSRDPDAISHILQVKVVSPRKRYLIASYRPSDLADYHIWLMEQNDNFPPVPLGAHPLTLDALWSDDFKRGLSSEVIINDLTLLPTGEPLVFGTFVGANFQIVPKDEEATRPLDPIHFVAAFNFTLNRFVQAFGGGPGAAVEAYTYDYEHKRFYVYSQELERVYTVSGSAGWFDESIPAEANTPTPWQPLVSRQLWIREAEEPGVVNDIYVLGLEGLGSNNEHGAIVGGHFDFVGPHTVGSIFATTIVPAGTEPEIYDVAGGLWHVDQSVERKVEEETYLVAGQVNTITSGFVGVSQNAMYVGGFFDRSADGVCLHNIARLSSISMGWESLEGGCDGPIYDILVLNKVLYVTGDFRKCGGVAVNYIAAYTTYVGAGNKIHGAWSSLNTGLQVPVADSSSYIGGLSLAAYGDGFVVGGYFTGAGGIITGPVAHWSVVNRKWSGLFNPCGTGCPELWRLEEEGPCPRCCVDDLTYQISALQIVSGLKTIGGNLYAIVHHSASEQDIRTRRGVVVMWDREKWTELSPRIWGGGQTNFSPQPHHGIETNATNTDYIHLGGVASFGYDGYGFAYGATTWHKTWRNTLDSGLDADDDIKVMRLRHADAQLN